MNISVSVVIPAHNAARFIGQAIESVFQQREAAADLDLDVIVVDNASTDAKTFTQSASTHSYQTRIKS